MAGNPFADELARLAGQEAARRQFLAAVRFSGGQEAYSRVLEGYPDWLCLTDAWWESYDAWNALWDRQERKYAHMLPKSLASMRAVARRIW